MYVHVQNLVYFYNWLLEKFWTRGRFFCLKLFLIPKSKERKRKRTFKNFDNLLASKKRK